MLRDAKNVKERISVLLSPHLSPCICLSEPIGFTANVPLPHSHGMFVSFVAPVTAGGGIVDLDLVDYRLVTFRALLMLTGSLHPLVIFFSSVIVILAYDELCPCSIRRVIHLITPIKGVIKGCTTRGWGGKRPDGTKEQHVKLFRSRYTEQMRQQSRDKQQDVN